MHNSPWMIQGLAIIEAVKGKTLSMEERCEAAIELAALILRETKQRQTKAERVLQTELARMLRDPLGKVFTTSLTDQCFRSQNPSRVADQIVNLLHKFGLPPFLSTAKRAQLKVFKWFGKLLPSLFVPLAKRMIRKQTSAVILPGEPKALAAHMRRRARQGVRVNLNHLGEAILGEEEALRRLSIYLEDLAKPEVEVISVKISTICSQLNLLSWSDTLEILAGRLRQLYRAAAQNAYKRTDGTEVPKFVNLDMEEYRDLELTVDLFRKVLDESEFFHHSAGIVLQSYLPDSYLLQQRLTLWAMERVSRGGAPIKIRIVKGANLAMEQVEAAIRGWPQAPYTNKSEVDANFKRMLLYACKPEHARAVHLGIASHNLFDVSFGLLVRAERGVEKEVGFEMLEGMAEPMRRAVKDFADDMLLYCPAATKNEFQNAVAYLVRRLDENTAPENFLRYLFELMPGTEQWHRQAEMFKAACSHVSSVSEDSRRLQNRLNTVLSTDPSLPFENEPDTDWSLPHNRHWMEGIIARWKAAKELDIPLVIGGHEWPPHTGSVRTGMDPSLPEKKLYRFRLAESLEVNVVLETAKRAEKEWQQRTPQERSLLLSGIAHKLREKRGDLIAAMVADGGKTIAEADSEVSEAIDFAEYYRRTSEEWCSLEDVQWRSKGTALVAPPWNFPCSIPFGGIAAALATGNCVIFKPALETVLVGWELVKVLWEGGVSKEVLQFLPCLDEPSGSMLVKDPRVNVVILTGATSTAKFLLKLRPGLDLVAETGGKNAFIITRMADRDLAIKDIIHSAFGHAGQKCSACSLAILEAEVYDDPHFKKQLRDAAASLKKGSAWDFSTRLNPLIRPPHETLKQGLTTLEKGEEWLLEPSQDQHNPNLWSPGIKWGVKAGSFTHQTELFGPVLGVMRADNLTHAIQLANGTPYGLTSGLHSLDERERQTWMSRIEAGNCYINRSMTGAVVRRQPFGGCKDSSFGKGFKAGGPNYVTQLMIPMQKSLPQLQEQTNAWVALLDNIVEKGTFTEEEKGLWKSSINSYAFFWNRYFSRDQDPSLLQGQDNLFRYLPQSVILRVQWGDKAIDILRVCAATLTCGAAMEISASAEEFESISFNSWAKQLSQIKALVESEDEFIKRVKSSERMRLRILQQPSNTLLVAAAEAACRMFMGPVLANGRLELLNHLREISFSFDYHRYGNLGNREEEKRAPLVGGGCVPQSKKCGAGCSCRV